MIWNERVEREWGRGGLDKVGRPGVVCRFRAEVRGSQRAPVESAGFFESGVAAVRRVVGLFAAEELLCRDGRGYAVSIRAGRGDTSSKE